MATPTYDVRVDWNGDGDFNDSGEDISARTLTRNTVRTQRGRDQVRSFSPISPGNATLEVDNTSKDYSPENSASPLFGNVGPGRAVRIRATHNAITYGVFQGFLEDYTIHPEKANRSVNLSAVDGLARLRQVEVATPFFLSLSTGQAIHQILNSAGWPTADRNIAEGASTLHNWWEDGIDAFTAIQRVMEAEGGQAIVYVSVTGALTFSSRTHRLVNSASITSQATFRSAGTEPTFTTEGFTYDVGWRDIINTATFDITERAVSPVRELIYLDGTVRALAAGETHTIRVHSDTAWYDIGQPVAPADYTVYSGSVTVTLSRSSGQTFDIVIFANTAALVHGMQVFGFKVETARTYQVSVEDSNSVQVQGRRVYTQSNPWISANDAVAVGNVLMAARSSRLPLVRIRLVGSNDTRLVQQLNRTFSDRITVIENESVLNSDFFIEQIEQKISQGGTVLETTFGCERAISQPSNVFTFDVAGRGFDDGRFGQTGVDDSATVFKFDHATQGQFDVGLFAN